VTSVYKAAIESHEQILIRRIVHWRNSPEYKLASNIPQIIKLNIQLPYIYNVNNALYFIIDLQSIKCQEKHKDMLL
jgi:hypothetical protein